MCCFCLDWRFVSKVNRKFEPKYALSFLLVPLQNAKHAQIASRAARTSWTTSRRCKVSHALTTFPCSHRSRGRESDRDRPKKRRAQMASVFELTSTQPNTQNNAYCWLSYVAHRSLAQHTTLENTHGPTYSNRRPTATSTTATTTATTTTATPASTAPSLHTFRIRVTLTALHNRPLILQRQSESPKNRNSLARAHSASKSFLHFRVCTRFH